MTKLARNASALFRSALAVVLLAGALLLGVGIAPASAADVAPLAAPPVSMAGGLTVDDCSDGWGCAPQAVREANFYKSLYRPINRWSGSTEGFFSKYDGFVGTQISEQAQRNVIQTMQMSSGNALTKSTGDMVQMTATLDILDAVGAQIDATARGISTVFISAAGGASTMLLALLIVCGVITIAVITVRGRGGLGLFLRRALSFGLVVAALIGMAVFSQSSSTTASGEYKPAPGTPTWIVKTTTDTISSIAEVPTSAFLAAVDAAQVDSGSDDSTGDPKAGLDCAAYETAMASSLSAQQAAAGQKSSLSMVVDSFWSATGLEVWKRVQTGVTAASTTTTSASSSTVNRFGQKMYCRILDDRSTAVTSTGNAASITMRAAGSDYYQAVYAARDKAPFAPVGNANKAASYVAWAACVPTGVSGDTIQWKWDSAWVGYKGTDDVVMDSTNAQDKCNQWWTMAGDQNLPDEFDVSGDGNWIADHTKAIQSESDRREVSSFLIALTGVDSFGSGGDTFFYLVGSVLTFGAFAWICLLVLIANLMTVFFAISIWFVLIRALFDTEPLGQVIAPAFKKFIGTAVVASTLTALLALVVLITKILTVIGNGLFGASNVFGMLWAGLSPLMSIILISVAFKQLTKRPSPFTLSGAKSWAKAGTGGAIGAAMIDRAGRGGKAAGSATKAGGSALANKVTGGRVGTPLGVSARRGAMSGKAAQIAGAGKNPTAGELGAEQRDEAAQSAPVGIRAQAAAWRADRRQYNEDLKAARAEYRASGELAPGDLGGAVRQRVNAAGEHVRDRGAALGQKVTGAIAATQVARGVQSRRDARLAARSGMDSERMRQYQAVQSAQLSRGARAAATVIDAPAAVANRARLGVQATSSAAQTGASRVWNSSAATAVRAEVSQLSAGTRAAASAAAQSKPVRAIAAGGATVAAGARVVKDSRVQNAWVVEQYRAKKSVAAPAAPQPKADPSPRQTYTRPESGSSPQRPARAVSDGNDGRLR